MRILVKEHEGHTIRLMLPSGLVLNSLTASFLPKYLEEQGIHITREQARVFVKELRFVNGSLARVLFRSN